MKLSIFILLLLFNIIRSQNLTSIELIDDNYSYVGYCKPVHHITVKATYEFTSIYFVDSGGTNITQSISNYFSIEKDGYYYYSAYLKSSFPLTGTSVSLFGFDLSSLSELIINNNGFQISYLCESPPETLDMDPANSISRVSTTKTNIVTSFYLNIKNLLKPIQQINILNPMADSPYSLTLVKSEPYFIQFKLTFSYPANSISSNGRIQFICSLFNPSSSTFEINIESPIKNYSKSIVNNLNQYPPSPVYYSPNNWNLKTYLMFGASNASSSLFLFYNVPGYSTQIDNNQYTTLVSGNYENGQYLSSFSYYPRDRDLLYLEYTYNSYVYGSSFSDNLAQSSMIYLESNSNISTFSSSFTGVVGKLSSFITYSFTTNNQDSFKFKVKIGDCNPFQLIYPYGIGSLISSEVKYQLSVLPSPHFYPSITLSSDVSSSKSGSIVVSKNDTTPPKIIDFNLYYPRGGDGNYAVLTVQINDDGNGFSHLYYAGNYITNSDLLSGSSDIYQKLIYITFGTQCMVYDKSGNYLNCDDIIQSNSLVNFYYDLGPPKFIPKLFNLDFEITAFSFESSSYDTSIVGRYAAVYLNYSISEYDIPISFFLLDRVYGDKYIDRNSLSNRYLMDKDLGLFRISVYIPPKLCTGPIPYLVIINGKEFKSDYFYSKFGDSAYLNINSNDCYELPPIVTKLNHNVSTDYVGWSFTIESSRDIKISYAYFHIISNLDKQGYKFEFKPNTVSFSSNIIIPISETLSQTFKIYNVTLIDERGLRSDFIDEYDYESITSTNPYPKYPPSFSPLYQFIDNIVLNISVTNTPPFAYESNLPTLLSVSEPVYNYTITDQATLEFYFTALDDTALSKRHIPIAYVESFTNYGDYQIIECQSKDIQYSQDNKTLTNLVKCNLPFGAYNGISISIYGIVDVNLNVAGFPSIYRNVSTLGSTYSSKPLIKSSTPLEVYYDKLTIIGNNLPNSNGKAYLYYSEGEAPTQITYNYSSSVLAILNIPKSNKQFTVYTQSSDNINSNFYKVSYIGGDSEEQVDIKCLDDCGGPTHGTCIQNIGCRCYSPYSGLNCMSETIKVPKPSVNVTSPDSTNEFNINGIKLNTIISFVALRELDIQSNPVNVHYFTEWNLTKISDSSFNYSSKIYKNNLYVSNIIINIQWFEDSSNITFANQTINISPSSLKYFISLDQYPFDSKLNSLELVIKTTFKSSETDEICSSKEFALNDGNDYMILKIGKYTLQGKFIKRGIINGYKIVSIENRFLDSFKLNGSETQDQDSSSQIYGYIGIEIMNYETSVLLDPSFSVLLDGSSTNSNNNNSICSNKSKKLTTAQLVGIIVAGVAVISLIIIFIVFKISKSLSFKIFYYKLFKKNKL